MIYFQLRSKKTGEVTSVFRDDDEWHAAPGVLIHPEYPKGYQIQMEDMYKAEIISKEEYETLLALYNIEWNHPSQDMTRHDHRLDFSLFVEGSDCP